ncbi:MAG TPA: TAXI family TRAP transporter solute-binding subunit [Xanthobacteraceae bacterium]|nr:TAXI family TRAP transporter solute-binding subunit [Xanthobacteraceae bacterium]
MGGARTALKFDRIHRCGLMLCAVLVMSFGGAELRAQPAPATRPAVATKPAHAIKPARAARRQALPKQPLMAARRQALPAQPLIASQRPAPLRQAAHTVRFKKIARSSKAAHKRARAGLDKPVVDRREVDKPAAPNDAAANLSERLNNNTVSIIAGEVGSTDLAVAHELSLVLDDGDNLRIMPMVGAGGGRNIRDIRFMKGVDLAITRPSLLARMRQSGEIGPIDDKIVYLTKLFNEEMHLVVRADAGVASIEHLAGRTVNLGETGSGTQSIAREVFSRLGIAVREVNMTERAAVEGLRSGDIDATIVIGGKPVPAVALMAAGFRLLPVPFAKQLRDDFLPAMLSNEDYPGLIEPGRRVETLAVGSVLVAYNWPRDSDRYQKIEKFVEAFFPRLGRLQTPPHHPKWREVNVAATLPGWTRFGAAEDWLREHREPNGAAREEFERFVGTRQARAATPDERERMYEEFLQWQQARERR